MTKLRKLTAEEEAKAERISAEGGMPVRHLKYFMRLPENLARWDKGSLAKVLVNREAMSVEIIDLLFTRLKVLEEKLGVTEKTLAATEHKGIWEGGRQYERGNFVTYRGSMWVAKKETLDEPGKSLEWQMVVRRGRDGRVRYESALKGLNDGGAT